MPTKTRAKKSAPQWPMPNPALQDLALLVGDWEMELSGAAFLPSPSDVVKGHVSFAWVEDGAFLEMRQGANPPNPASAVWLISRDESSGAYQVLYYDARGVSRIYQMSFQGGVWKMWRDWPAFRQRFEGRLSKDGNTIEAYWEKSAEWKPWERDFNMTFVRAPKPRTRTKGRAARS